jgi:hypothetical protein
MSEYSLKLSVVGTSNGQFLVNHYNRIPDRKVESVEAVIDFMSGLDFSVLKATPCYQHLNPADHAMIEGARQGIIKRESLTKAKSA